MPRPGRDELLLAERSLRSRLNALVHERAEALREADKLQVKATRVGGTPALATEAEHWRQIAARVAGEIEAKREQLRAAEQATAAADATAADADADQPDP